MKASGEKKGLDASGNGACPSEWLRVCFNALRFALDMPPKIRRGRLLVLAVRLSGRTSELLPNKKHPKSPHLLVPLPPSPSGRAASPAVACLPACQCQPLRLRLLLLPHDNARPGMDGHPANAAGDSLGDLFPHQAAALVSFLDASPPR